MSAWDPKFQNFCWVWRNWKLVDSLPSASLRLQENFQKLLGNMVGDLKSLQQEGFIFQREKWYLICLGLKGDMPFLRTAGGFNRHWQRAIRTADPSTNPFGVCWKCLAGTRPGGPFEDFNMDALWAKTSTVNPWVAEPSPLQLFHCVDRPHDYFKCDVWHNYHGGAGRTFIASVLVECLSIFDGSKDDKISQLNSFLHEWAKLRGCSLPHSGSFTSERVGLTSFQVLPEGSWSKFADTHVYHKFLEWFLSKREEEIQTNEILSIALEAIRAINKTFSTLYSWGLWLEPNEAFLAGTGGRKWLALYARLAHTCFVQRRLRFPVYVKFHMLDHQFRSLISGSSKPWTLNILCESVQADEDSCSEMFRSFFLVCPCRMSNKLHCVLFLLVVSDFLFSQDFVGRCCRISRRISPKTVGLRVLQRYLVMARKTWEKQSLADKTQLTETETKKRPNQRAWMSAEAENPSERSFHS